MEISDSRKCNLMNLAKVEVFLDVPNGMLRHYYEELLEDIFFIEEVNRTIAGVKRKNGFNKGIFRMETIPTVDWFAFERILLYVITRHYKPANILETGVYYGGNTAFLLLALFKNGWGSLISIDYPDAEIIKTSDRSQRHVLVSDTELYDSTLQPGFMIPQYLTKQWSLFIGDSHEVIPKLSQEFNLFVHDSEHSMKFLTKELELASEKLSKDALLIVDDIDWSNAFFAYCVKRRLSPMLLTDNGKDDLRVRTGLVALNHQRNQNPPFN